MNIRNFKRDDIFVRSIIPYHQIWKDNERYSYLRQGRSDNGFSVVTHGKAVYTTKEGATLNAAKGDIIFLPKASEYKVVFYAAEGMSRPQNLLVNFSIRDMFGNEVELSDRIELLGRDITGGVYRIISDMPELYRKNESLLLKSRFYALANEIVNLIINDSEDGMSVALRYIENNICSAVSIAKLAKLCSMSESGFRKRFKDMTGVSPVRYINNLKINKAKELLSSSEISVEEISNFLNFYDKSYFCKVFKEIACMTPIQYKHETQR